MNDTLDDKLGTILFCAEDAGTDPELLGCLENLGYEVIVANEPRQIVGSAVEESPDLIILEKTSAEFDGGIMIDTIENVKDTCTIPRVIIAEGVDQDEELELLRKTGATDVIKCQVVGDAITEEKLKRYVKSGQNINRANAERDMRHDATANSLEASVRLVGGVAHKFNNVLHAVTGTTNYLLGEEVNPSDRERALRDIVDATDAAAEFVDILLALSGRQETRRQAVQINTAFREVHYALKELMPSNISIRHKLEPNLGTIDADHEQIKRVIMHLYMNALEAMDGGEISFMTEEKKIGELHRIGVPAGDYVIFSIMDEGPGMSKQVTDKIFEPFYSTKAESDVAGKGLGLAIVYGAVKSLGGEIKVYSELGVGSRFDIFFKRGSLEEIAVGEQSRADSIGPGKNTILIVDDEPLLRKTNSRMVKSLGYDVITAPDGPKALELYDEHRDSIYAVMLDVIMPSMGGTAVCKQLKDINPAVRVFFSSGYTFENNTNPFIVEAVSNGRALSKPYGVEELEAALNTFKD